MANLDYNYIAELIQKIKLGDSNAFAEFYAATYQPLYRYANNYLRDEYLAQDALQETYIMAYKSIYTLNDDTLAMAWIKQICFHVCYNMHKKQERYDGELTSFDEDTPESNIPAASTPEKEVIEVDSRQYLMNQVLNLPFSESQVIIMKYYQGRQLDEIAELMDMSRSTVKRYLRSGKERLARILKDY